MARLLLVIQIEDARYTEETGPGRGEVSASTPRANQSENLRGDGTTDYFSINPPPRYDEDVRENPNSQCWWASLLVTKSTHCISSTPPPSTAQCMIEIIPSTCPVSWSLENPVCQLMDRPGKRLSGSVWRHNTIPISVVTSLHFLQLHLQLCSH